MVILPIFTADIPLGPIKRTLGVIYYFHQMRFTCPSTA